MMDANAQNQAASYACEADNEYGNWPIGRIATERYRRQTTMKVVAWEASGR